MATKRAESPTLLDVLDRVLDKGVVFDFGVPQSRDGIHLSTLEAHVITGWEGFVKGILITRPNADDDDDDDGGGFDVA